MGTTDGSATPEDDRHRGRADLDGEAFWLLVEAAADALMVIDLEGVVRYANPAAGPLLGRERVDLAGYPFGVPVVDGGATEVDVLRPDGTTCIAEMRAVEIVWAGVSAYHASLRDVTERKIAEEAARAATATLRSFYDHAGVMLGVVELLPGDGLRFVSANAATSKFYGRRPGELDGRILDGLTVPADVVERWMDACRDAERASAPVRFEYARTAARGSVWLSATVGFIDRPFGSPPRFSFVVEDVTDRKRAAEAAAEADRRKDEFLATLAHELRNPLAPIRNGLQILKLTDAGARSGPVRDMMERQVSHMVRLVDDLLDVSRITRGKIDLRRESVDLADVVKAAAETSRPPIEAGGHELSIDVPSDSVCVDGDPARLAQVFSNLLNNAAKYTPDGGRVRVTVGREGNTGVVRVADTGVGIPADMLPRVFDLFAQVNRSLDRSQGGLGIGLSLVKRLVELHGGAVEARSDGPDKGSEFVVRLPLLPTPAAVDGGCDAPPAATGPRRRILVVDDNADAANTLGELLEIAGHEVRVARDGAAGVAEAAGFRPEVILMDLGMPGMDGYEAARRILASPTNVRPVLVALTGRGTESDRQRTRDAGFDHHLVKPVDAAAISGLLDAMPARKPG